MNLLIFVIILLLNLIFSSSGAIFAIVPVAGMPYRARRKHGIAS